jgi:Uma2 family endonuclease
MGVARTRSEPPPRLPEEPAATLDDLYRYDGKAELIGGRIVPLLATGRLPNRIAFRITRSLDDYAQAAGRGEAHTDKMGFGVPRLRSGRESFSPDASFYDGVFPANEMRFVSGPPTLAVEVRIENDYGAAAENEIAAKRRDYFEAGTKVMWDVDSVAKLIRSYRADAPEEPMVFARGQTAHAEPAVPGWRIDVDQIFG